MSQIQGKAPNEREDGNVTVVGINVSGLAGLVRQLAKVSPSTVVMEAIGRYHRAAWLALHGAGIRVAAVNPYRSRRFADVIGRLAKTDIIDAQVLARFGATMQPQPSEPPSEIMSQIAEIAVARRQLVAHRVTLEQQLSETSESCRRPGRTRRRNARDA